MSLVALLVLVLSSVVASSVGEPPLVCTSISLDSDDELNDEELHDDEKEELFSSFFGAAGGANRALFWSVSRFLNLFSLLISLSAALPSLCADTSWLT